MFGLNIAMESNRGAGKELFMDEMCFTLGSCPQCSWGGITAQPETLWAALRSHHVEKL